MNDYRFNYRAVAVQQALPLSGLHHADISTREEFMTNQLIATLTAYVLTDQGGETVRATSTHTVEYVAPRFPRWMPRRLRRRWSVTEQTTVRATLAVDPLWSYPSADVAISPMGAPVQIVDNRGVGWADS